MLKRLFTNMFGKFESKQEVIKYVLLGLTFGVIIAAYWALRPVKDGIFQSIVGVDYTPYAKGLSLVVVLLLIGLYGKLVDMFPRNKVFYIITGVYGLGALALAFLLVSPMGLPNTVESPTRLIGWFTYVFIESFATLTVPLFWAFSADVSTPESAKRGFPLIMLCAQIGNVLGPLLLRAKFLGFATSGPIIGIAGSMILTAGLLIWFFMRVVPAKDLEGYHAKAEPTEKKEKPGFLEGLKLLVSNGYLLGIFFVYFAYEVIQTIIDFYWKVQVKAAFPVEVDRSNFLAWFAVSVGLVSSLSILLGISKIQRRLGMKASLIAMPILVSIGVVLWRLSVAATGSTLFGFEMSMLAGFIVLVVFKALNYALNQPSIKQLYIPTSKDARYKAQAWIEVFGSRGSKTAGSGINALKLPLSKCFGPATGMSLFLTLATGTSLGLLAIWVFVAIYVAQKYTKAVKENTVVC